MPALPGARDAAPEGVLHPEIAPYATGRLAVDPPHTLYFECCGNPDGPAVVFLHGGPGGGCLPHHRRFFDPAFWRIVLFDQRGAGRSTPFASIERNDTAALVGDIARLLDHLAIDRALFFGGSWGSTLALAFGQKHPERCTGLVLRGIFLARQSELDWFLHGMKTVFPEAARAFALHLPANERDDLLGNYHRRLIDPDPAIHLSAAQAWDRYEGACSMLVPATDAPSRAAADGAALALARIESHYFVHRAFLEEGELLRGVPKLRHLPCTIVQGRYDIVCPPVTADELARAWPEADYIVVPDAGHSVREPGIARALVAAVGRMQERVRRR